MGGQAISIIIKNDKPRFRFWPKNKGFIIASGKEKIDLDSKTTPTCCDARHIFYVHVKLGMPTLYVSRLIPPCAAQRCSLYCVVQIFWTRCFIEHRVIIGTSALQYDTPMIRRYYKTYENTLYSPYQVFLFFWKGLPFWPSAYLSSYTDLYCYIRYIMYTYIPYGNELIILFFYYFYVRPILMILFDYSAASS